MCCTAHTTWWYKRYFRYGIPGLFHWLPWNIMHFTRYVYPDSIWFHHSSVTLVLQALDAKRRSELAEEHRKRKQQVPVKTGGWGMLIHTLSPLSMTRCNHLLKEVSRELVRVSGSLIFETSLDTSMQTAAAYIVDVRRWQKRWLMLHVMQLSKRRALSLGPCRVSLIFFLTSRSGMPQH